MDSIKAKLFRSTRPISTLTNLQVLKPSESAELLDQTYLQQLYFGSYCGEIHPQIDRRLTFVVLNYSTWKLRSFSVWWNNFQK